MWPRTVAIALTGVMLIGLAPGAARAQAGESDQQFVFAYQLMRRGEKELAADAFASFISQYSQDRRVADAHYYLALLLRQQGNAPEALKHLRQAQRTLNVPRTAVLLLIGQVALEMDRAPDAVRVLESIDPAQLKDDQTKATHLYLLGLAQRQAGNVQGAVAQLGAASKLNSTLKGAALLELGRSQAALNQSAEAIGTLRSAAETNRAVAGDALALAGQLAYRAGQYDLAGQLYARIIEQHAAHPAFKAAVIGRLRALSAGQQDQQLIEQHAALTKLLDAQYAAEAHYLLGVAHVRKQQHDKGVAVFERFLRSYPKDARIGSAAYLYAICLLQTQRYADFDRIAGQLRATQADPLHLPDLQYLQAQAAVRREQYDRAAAFLSPLVDPADGAYAKRALLQRAALYEKTGRQDLAQRDYAMFSERYGQDPEAGDAARRAINLAFATGDAPRVIELAVPWLTTTKAGAAHVARVRLKLAVAYLQLHRADKALPALEALLAGQIDDKLAALGHYYRGRLLSRAVLASANPASNDAQAKRIAEAVRSLAVAATGALPEAQQIEALGLTARLHQRAGQTDAALAAFEQLAKRQGRDRLDTPTAVWIGRELAQLGRHEQALGWLTMVTGRKNVTDAARAEAMFLAAGCQQKLQQHDKAIDAYMRLLAFGGGFGEQGRLGLAQCMAATGRAEEAIGEYDGLLNVESSHVRAAAFYESALLKRQLADQYAQAGAGQRAADELNEVRKRLNRVIILYDLDELSPIPQLSRWQLGRIAVEHDELDKARRCYEEMAERFAATDWAQLAQAELDLLSGKRGDAMHRLKQLIGDKADADVKPLARERLRELGGEPS